MDINFISDSNSDEICNYDYTSNSNEKNKDKKIEIQQINNINKNKNSSNNGILIPRLPFHTERNLQNNDLSDFIMSQIKKIGTTKIYNNNIVPKTQRSKKNIKINYYQPKDKKTKKNKQGLSNKEMKIKKYFSFNSINKIGNSNKIFNNSNEIIITQKSNNHLINKKQNTKSNSKPKIKKSPNSHIHAFTSNYINPMLKELNETKKLIRKRNSINKFPSNFDSVSNEKCDKKKMKYNIKKRFISTSMEKKFNIKNTMAKWNPSLKQIQSENNKKKYTSISSKNKILRNNSDYGDYAIKKFKSHLCIDKNLDSNTKITNLQKIPKSQSKSNKLIFSNKTSTQLLQKKISNNSIKGKNYILNKKRILEKKVIRDKNNTKLKKTSPFYTERNNSKNYKTQTDHDKFYITSKNSNRNINQIISKKNHKIVYERINKISQINYQNNNINNFYIIQDNNKLEKLPNSECKQNILPSYKYNMNFSNSNFTIELNKMKSIENKKKRGFNLKYMIANKYRNRSFNNSKDKNKIKNKLINLKDNKIKAKNNNINQEKGNNNSLRALRNLPRNAKSKSKDSDSRIIDDDSEFSGYECEINITPKKKNDHMKINPVKLLGDFKKEFNKYSKKDKKHWNIND